MLQTGYNIVVPLLCGHPWGMIIDNCGRIRGMAAGKLDMFIKGLFSKTVAAYEGWPLVRGKLDMFIQGLF